MLYDYLKILHIIAATLVLTSIAHSFRLWWAMRQSQNSFGLFNRIQKQTTLVIMPGALVQLATGFTIISLQHYAVADAWVTASISGFIVLIAGWLGFIYFLAAAQKNPSGGIHRQGSRARLYRKLQTLMLMLCALALSIMIFSMANRLTLHGPA